MKCRYASEKVYFDHILIYTNRDIGAKYPTHTYPTLLFGAFRRCHRSETYGSQSDGREH
jgi:hypothetical protein